MTTTSRKTRARRGLAGIFAVPVLLFAISLGGLVTALLIDGWSDIVASLAAAAGLLATAWTLIAR